MRKLTRRSFLRSASSAALSLPWLESIAAAAPASAATKAVAQRMAHFYVPIGVVRRGFFPGEAGAIIPTFEGGARQEIKVEKDNSLGQRPLELTPTLEPLAAVQDKVTLITGMDRTFQEGTDVHAQCASCYLSSAPPFSVKQSAWPLDRTLDHIVADHVGGTTPFRSLEFSCNTHQDNKESIYFDNISWYGTGHVAPSLRDPRQIYRRLFSTDEIQDFRNITDLVLDDARSLKRDLGYTDQQKFAEYFDSIRTIEEQMDKLEKMKAELATVQFDEPTEAHLPRGEYIRLMSDLMVVALQSGLTNVATFMVGPERWDTPFTFETLFDDGPRSHHKMSHNQNKFLDDLLQVDRFHMERFVYLVEKMEAIKEADGSSLLDNTILTYGSGLGDGSTHQYTDLPIILAGATTQFGSKGKHVNLQKGTPLANLWLTQANAMGAGLERFADSPAELGMLKA